jgi:hypothetical protein
MVNLDRQFSNCTLAIETGRRIPEVHEAVLSDRDIASVVWQERRLDKCPRANLSEHLRQHLSTLLLDLLIVSGVRIEIVELIG